MKPSFLFLLLFLAPSLMAEEASFEAAKFHQSHCTGCHDTSVYTRPDRRVNSLPRLESQVRMCDANLGIKLFDDDIAALVEFLNTHYYKFDR